MIAGSRSSSSTRESRRISSSLGDRSVFSGGGRMKSSYHASIFAIAVVLCLPCAPTRAQTTQESDRAAIVQLGTAWEKAWNSRDADALASLLAEDADFVTVLGPNGWLKGRARFDSVHARMFPRYFTRSAWK